MNKLKAADHAEAMKRAMGLPKAHRVAYRMVEGTKLSNRSSLPRGEVFYQKDFGGNLKLIEKPLDKTHNFWLNVYGILNKQFDRRN